MGHDSGDMPSPFGSRHKCWVRPATDGRTTPDYLRSGSCLIPVPLHLQPSDVVGAVQTLLSSNQGQLLVEKNDGSARIWGKPACRFSVKLDDNRLHVVNDRGAYYASCSAEACDLDNDARSFCALSFGINAGSMIERAGILKACFCAASSLCQLAIESYCSTSEPLPCQMTNLSD